MAKLEAQNGVCGALAVCFGGGGKTQSVPSSPLRVVITGAPASGKGTQCERIVERYGLVHLSTGDALRAAVQAGTAVGLQAKEKMQKGELVPDELVIAIVLERLREPDCVERGWLLDGFPRTGPQADALSAASQMPTHVCALGVPDDVLVERVSTRRLDPVTGGIYNIKNKMPEDADVAARLIQRADDTEDAIRVRLATFHQNVAALRATFPSMIDVDGNRPADRVFTDVCAILDQ